MPGIWTVLGQTLEQERDSPGASAEMRAGRELLKATQPFAVESVRHELVACRFHLRIAGRHADRRGERSRLAVAIGCFLLGGMFMVRAFIMYHDYMHGAILSDSRLASLMFRAYAAACADPAEFLEKEPQLSPPARRPGLQRQHWRFPRYHHQDVA